MATEATASAKKTESINEFIEKQMPEYAKALEGSGLTAQRFARVAITTIRGSDKLMECTGVSLLASLLRAAQAGILPDGRRAYLIPRKNHGTMEATYMLGFQGMIEIAMRDPEVIKISTAVVYKKDEFIYELGLNEKLQHVPSMDEDRGEKIFVYAIARMKNGEAFFEVLDKKGVHRARSVSSGYAYDKEASVWATHEEAMWRKTAVRALFKYLPNVDALAEAIGGDDMDFTNIDATPKPKSGGIAALKSAVMGDLTEPEPMQFVPPALVEATATATALSRINAICSKLPLYDYHPEQLDGSSETTLEDVFGQVNCGEIGWMIKTGILTAKKK